MTTLTGPTYLPTRDLDWQRQSACSGTETDTFFLPDGIRGSKKRAREAAAKAICQTCPVMANCRNWALTVAEPYGVWGGTTPEERDQISTPGRMTA